MKTPLFSMMTTCAFFGLALLASNSQPSNSQLSRDGFHKVTPPIKAAKSSCAPRRGVRLTIYGFWSVSNAEDGFRDNNVEMFGAVNFNGQNVWRVSKQNAISSKDRRNSINTASRTFDVIFDNPATWTLRVNGFLYDFDKGSDNEPMWNPRQQVRNVNIKRMNEQSEARRDARVYLPGDRDSESADLVILISKSEDIF